MWMDQWRWQQGQKSQILHCLPLVLSRIRWVLALACCSFHIPLRHYLLLSPLENFNLRMTDKRGIHGYIDTWIHLSRVSDWELLRKYLSLYHPVCYLAVANHLLKILSSDWKAWNIVLRQPTESRRLDAEVPEYLPHQQTLHYRPHLLRTLLTRSNA